jgi:uncharacterized protein with NRDE domain
MCLILFDWDPDGDYPLTVLANRDEFHDRPARQAHFWEDKPDILAGRDLKEGGTWMGVTAGGRFAAVTNFRSPKDMQPGRRSRGELPVGFLDSRKRSDAYMEEVLSDGDDWAGFNLLLFDGVDLVWGSNRAEDGMVRLEPGIHGLSNALLDTPWPKVVDGKRALKALLHEDDYIENGWLSVLSDASMAPDAQLPDTGVGLEKERLLSARRIVSSGYGTRCSTLIRLSWDGSVEFIEKTWIPVGLEPDTVEYYFDLD